MIRMSGTNKNKHGTHDIVVVSGDIITFFYKIPAEKGLTKQKQTNNCQYNWTVLNNTNKLMLLPRLGCAIITAAGFRLQ